MQISLRSQLIAGTAAVVGASAIAMTPVTAAHISLPSVQVPSAAQVALAGFDSPISELLNTFVLTTNYLFNTGPAPVGLNPNWAVDIKPSDFPFSGFGQGIPLFPAALANPSAGGYSSIGLIPQIIDDALPIIRQLGFNGSDYLQAATSGLYAAGYSLSEGVWNAAGDLLSFDIPGAIQTLFDSINEAGTYALLAGGYVASGVFNRAVAVVETVIDLLPTLLAATLGQIQVIGNSAATVVTDFIGALGGGDFEGAWNAVVDGLLGPSGIPGTIVNLTVGAGVQTEPITAFNPVTGEYTPSTAFIPSTRTLVQGGVKAIAGALATPVQLPTASTPAPAASADSTITEVTELAAAPAGDASADSSAVATVTESDPPAADAPASPRGARSAASVAAPAASAGDDEGAATKTPKRASRSAKKASSAE